MAVTLQDVAARAGVSAITASRALNNSGYVSPETKRRVEEAAAALDYIPNAVASSLRSQRTQLVALLLTDVTNPFWTTVARGVEDAAMAAGYAVILCNTDEDPAKESLYLDLLLRRRIDGLLVGPTANSVELLAGLKRHNTPFVLVDRRVAGTGADNVRGDSHGGAYQLTMHLLRTGYRRIAMISGPLAVSTAEDRIAGYRTALAAGGVEADEELLCCGSFRQAWGYQATKDLMSRAQPPDAIFAANYLIALGVLEALAELRLRVPEDVALVSFDAYQQPSIFPPFLTTLAQPAAEIGRVAMRLLLDRLAKPDQPAREIVLPGEMVIRTSCGCAPGEDQRKSRNGAERTDGSG